MSKLRREILNVNLIICGILSAAMGINGFLLSSSFIDGGVTGISMLLSKVTSHSLSYWLPIVNLPFIILAIRHIGVFFALRSIIAIIALALVLAFVPFPDVTSDRILTAIFGGFFVGAGIGLAIRGGAVLDGTEIAALIISKKLHALKVGDVILGFNVLLFIVAMTTLGVDTALYSILTYFSAAKILDFVLYGIDEYTAVTVVSDKHKEIRELISDELGRGVTVFKGYGGRSGVEKDILYCVITRLEVGKVKAIVRSVDSEAFIVFNALSGAEGSNTKEGILY